MSKELEETIKKIYEGDVEVLKNFRKDMLIDALIMISNHKLSNKIPDHTDLAYKIVNEIVRDIQAGKYNHYKSPQYVFLTVKDRMIKDESKRPRNNGRVKVKSVAQAEGGLRYKFKRKNSFEEGMLSSGVKLSSTMLRKAKEAISKDKKEYQMVKKLSKNLYINGPEQMLLRKDILEKVKQFKSALKDCMRELDSRNLKIMEMLFDKPMSSVLPLKRRNITLEKIGKTIGVSSSRVCQLTEEIAEKLKECVLHKLGKEYDDYIGEIVL